MGLQRHETFLIDKVVEHKYCGNSFLELSGGSYEVPFAIEPTDGKHSLESCQGCRKAHKKIIEHVQERFDEFPNCCEKHKRLMKSNGFEFNRSDFGDDFPKKFADKVLFTYHHIINRLEDENWYVEITDYIDYAFTSLGSFPPNYGGSLCFSEFLSFLNQMIGNFKGELEKELDDPIEKEETLAKINKVVSYINDYSKAGNISPKSTDNDISTLLSTYEEWLNIFPFDLPFFKGLKEHFQRTIPLIKGTRHNKYLGMTFGKPHTRNGLIILLIERTKLLLTKINGVELYEKGKLTNAEKVEIDLILQNRKLELKTLGQKRNDTTKKYQKVIQEWFKGEIDFIGKIKPLLQNKEIKAPTKKASEKNFDVNDFKFSSDILLKSKEEFEAFLNQRYGDKYQSDQLNQIVDKYHGGNTLAVQQEAQKKVDAKAYINSLNLYDLFKKSMEDENHNCYYRTLETTWEQSREEYINENGLKEVDGNSLLLFNKYLSDIFGIYRHAYEHHEKDSVKDLNLIPLKKAKFDCLMNEQTNHFVAHLKSEKVKGNYKMLLDRKDYVLGLFGSLERFLGNASINFDKSPFKEIFDTSKGKIENAVSFDEVKFLAGQPSTNTGATTGANPFPSIFKDSHSYQLFEKLHEQYKSNTSTLTASYSFVFYAMQSDGYVICKGTEFISFLSENFQIEIDRIDARQSGSNRKTSFYVAIKSATITQ